MEDQNAIELLNAVAKTHERLYSFRKQLETQFSGVLFRFDLSMYSVNREEWPGSPIGITWEINMDDLDKEFFFELSNETKWRISSEVSQSGLETIETIFDLEFDNLSKVLIELPSLVDRFEIHCTKHLKT